MLKNVLRNDLQQVKQIMSALVAQDSPFCLKEMNTRLLQAQGKFLRPFMVIAIAKTLDPLPPKQMYNAAAACEFVHAATLVHDDIIDKSMVRHDHPTFHVTWGENAAITYGDYLFSLALESAAVTNNTEIINALSQALRKVCRGQLAQLTQRHNYLLSEQEYFAIIEGKTGALFAAACMIGSLCVHKSSTAAYEFGKYFGNAYQMVDDYNDIMKEEKDTAKSKALDLYAGEITLPLILLREKTSQAHIRSLIKAQNLEGIRKEIKKHRIDQSLRQEVERWCDKAKHCLDQLPSNETKQTLVSLVETVQNQVR